MFFLIECEYYLFKSLHGIASSQKTIVTNDKDYEFNKQVKTLLLNDLKSQFTIYMISKVIYIIKNFQKN